MFFITTLIAFLYELYLAIPFVGGATVIASGYTALTIAFVIHVIVLIFRITSRRSIVVPVIALLLTLLAWIPVLGWFFHVVIAVLYLFDLIIGLFNKPERRAYN